MRSPTPRTPPGESQILSITGSIESHTIEAGQICAHPMHGEQEQAPDRDVEQCPRVSLTIKGVHVD